MKTTRQYQLLSTFAAALVLLLIALASATSALAADRWWDGPNDAGAGDGVGQGGGAGWGSSNTNWDQGLGLDHTNWVNAAEDTAVFEGAPGTVSITHGNGVTVSALIFQTNGFTLNSIASERGVNCRSGGIITYVNVASNATATINAMITNGPSSGRQLQVGGRGTLVLNGSNMFNGKIIIGNNTPANGSTAIFNGGNGNGQTPTVQASIIADLGVASSLGQQSTVANGTIQIGDASSAGVLEYTGTNAASTDRKVVTGSNTGGSGSATVRNNNADPNHTLTFSNPNFNEPATNVNGFNRTLILSGSNTGDNTITGQITNNVGTTLGLVNVTKTGSGVWVLGGSNAYSGATTVSGGVLKLNNSNAIPGGIGASNGTSSLTLSGGVVGLTTNSGDFNRPIGSGADQVQWTANGGFAAYGGIVSVQFSNTTINWTSGGFIGGGKTLILGSIVADGTLDWKQPVSLNGAARTVQVNNGSAAIDAIISAVITGGTAGNAPLTKSGTGTLSLTAANSWNGNMNITGGTLMLGDGTVGGDSGRIGPNASNIVISAGAVLAINRNNSLIQGASSGLGSNAPISGAGSVLMMGGNNGTGILGLNQSNSFMGGLTLNAGTLRIESDGDSVTGTGPLGTNGGTFTINGGAIDCGGASRVIQTTNPMVVNANFAFSSTNDLTLPGDVDLGAATRTITTSSNAATLTLAGVLSNGGLTKAGPGVLNLTGANSYTNNTTVNGGTLKVAVASFDTNSTVSVAAGAQLSLDFAETNIVAGFVTNGVALVAGVYNSANVGSFLAGTGSLQVGSGVPSGPTPEPITRTVSGGNLILGWTQPGWKLATGTNVTAITNIIPGATSPYTNSLSEPKRFYRLTYP